MTVQDIRRLWKRKCNLPELAACGLHDLRRRLFNTLLRQNHTGHGPRRQGRGSCTVVPAFVHQAQFASLPFRHEPAGGPSGHTAQAIQPARLRFACIGQPPYTDGARRCLTNEYRPARHHLTRLDFSNFVTADEMIKKALIDANYLCFL